MLAASRCCWSMHGTSDASRVARAMCWTANGQAILRAIVAGERNPYVLAGLKNARVHATDDEIASSLRGNWRADWA
jgi:hypothetical protein